MLLTARRLAFWFFFMVVFTLARVETAAQNLRDEIDGTIRDSSGRVIPNATVTVNNTDQNTVASTVQSDQRGQFTAPLLAIGHYAVSVSAAGFENRGAFDRFCLTLSFTIFSIRLYGIG